jgi:hypothetical protein
MNAPPPSVPEETPFEKFKSLARKLVAVPKSEIDKQEKPQPKKKNRRGKRK